MNYLLSVIIPVYNVEKYLARCIESIIRQTYDKLEIILINDGSSDNSKSICDKYAKNDSRIIVINQENSGSSIARNTGLDKCTGDIISFIDSDDYIELTMFEQMISLLYKHNLEVVEIAPNNLSRTDIYNLNFTIEDKITSFQRVIKKTYFSVWRRIYKRQLIKNMRFIPNIIHQDVFFTIDVLNKVDSIGYLDIPLYNYNNEGESVIRSKYTAHKRDIAIKATEYIIKNAPNYPEVKKAVNNYVISYYTEHFFLISRNKHLDPQKIYRSIFRNAILKVVNFQNIKLRTFLVLFFPYKLIEIISTYYKKLKTN